MCIRDSAWTNDDKCTQTKMIVKAPKQGTGQFLRSRGRQTLRLLTQVITGHNTLNKHLFVMGLVESPVCTKCGQGDETSLHYLAECGFYATIRENTLGSYFLRDSDLYDISIPDFLKFIKKSGRFIDPSENGGSAQ